MPNVTLMDGANQYLDSLSAEDRVAVQGEVQRFVRWCGADRILGELRGQEVANYSEVLTGTVSDGSERADSVKRFLAFAKKIGHTETNLGAHLRVRKTAGRSKSSVTQLKEFEMSADQKAVLEKELEGLKAQRPEILADLQRAMADKDFRENAPLDAARERQGYVEARIRELDAKISRAIVVDDSRPTGRGGVEVGSTVHLRNLGSDKETIFTVVRPGEANAAKGMISLDSPVGKALVQRRAGDEVEVAAPSGTLRFRIERIEGQ